MHASLLVSVLLLFCRHVPAAPNNNRGLGEPPGQAAGGIPHHVKRYDDGFWYPGKYPDGGTQDPVTPPDEQVGAPEDGTRAPAAPEETTAPPEEDTTAEPSLEKPKETKKPEKPKEEETPAPEKPEKTKPPEGEKPKETPAPEKPEGPAPEKPDEEEEEKDKQDCRPLSENKYLPRDPLINVVKEFCRDNKGRARDENSGGIGHTYYSSPDNKLGTADEVIIGQLPRSYSQVLLHRDILTIFRCRLGGLRR